MPEVPVSSNEGGRNPAADTQVSDLLPEVEADFRTAAAGDGRGARA